MVHSNNVSKSFVSIVILLIYTQFTFAAVDIPLVQLSSNVPVEPNIMFVLDDSSSMRYTVTPSKSQYQTDSYFFANTTLLNSERYSISRLFCGDKSPMGVSIQNWLQETESSDFCRRNHDKAGRLELLKLAQLDWRVFSADYDLTRYDPNRTYKPWSGYSDLDFHNVKYYPQSSNSQILDMGTLDFSYTVWKDTAGWTPPLSQANLNQIPNGVVDIWDDFDQYYFTEDEVAITSTSFAPHPNIVDCRPDTRLDSRQEVLRCFNGSETSSTQWNNRWGRTLEEEQTNIANWFGYHRERRQTLAGLVGQIMEDHPSFRYGLTSFNSVHGEQLIPSDANYDKTSQNQAILDVAILNPANTRTSTRKGLGRALQHFRDTDPATRPIIEACQQNFAFILSDGFEIERK